MNQLTQYILSVTAAAVLASILRILAGEGAMEKLTKLLTGLFLAVTVLSPLVRLEIPDPSHWLEDYLADGDEAARAGEVMAKEYSAAIITEEVEAYILDKAASMGAALAVEVELGEGGLPETVTLTGSVSPGHRAELSRTMDEELGVEEEAQIWID